MCVRWMYGRCDRCNIYIEYTGAALKYGDISIEMIIGILIKDLFREISTAYKSLKLRGRCFHFLGRL